MLQSCVMSASEPLVLSESGCAFLSARWERLCLFNYSVEPESLSAYLPPGLSLDLLDGRAHVSLVAFDFLKTRVFGVSWPYFRNFPEINLRFYVREGERRGVAFIRELVPNPLVAWVARLLYNEPYYSLRMKSEVERAAELMSVRHTITSGKSQHSLLVRAQAEPIEAGVDEEAEFFKEHSWGYGTSRRGALVRYEVRHPLWRTHPVESYELEWDFGAVYGSQWSFLNQETPRSVYLAEGSAVVVSPKL